MKAQLDEGGGRILLGDDTGGEAVMLRPIRLRCVGFRISAGLHCIYMYIANDIYAIFISDSRKFRLALDLPVFDCFASWGVSILPGSSRVSRSWIIPVDEAVYVRKWFT